MPRLPLLLNLATSTPPSETAMESPVKNPGIGVSYIRNRGV
jgi:hypothetical protein